MEVYCGAYRDFVVPEDQYLFDSIPSPDSWSNWGMSASDNFGSLDKVFTLEAKTTKGDFDFNHRSLGHDTGLEKSFHNKPQSGGSGMIRGLSEPSFDRRAVCYDQTNYQLQDLGAFEATDDYFLNSILEYPPTGIADGKHFCTSSGCQFGKSCRDNPMVDVIPHSSSTPSDICNMGVSEYAKPLPFSLLRDSFTPFNFKEKSCPLKEGETVEGLDPLEQENRNLCSCDDLSLEEYILEELEMVISQLAEKTRKCFRDALYRLARNSFQLQGECYQDYEYRNPIERQTSGIEPLSSIRHGEGGGTKEKELETNSIDRAIATLMFDKMDFNLHEISGAASANSDQQMLGTVTVPAPGSPFSSTKHRTYSTCQIHQGDAEVPRFSHMDQQTVRDLNQNDVVRSNFNFAAVT